MFFRLENGLGNSSTTVSLYYGFYSVLYERVAKKEISGSTLRNYYKPIKLFCDVNNIILNWKLIVRGLPTVLDYGQDRAPTVDEIQKLLEYDSDNRMKPIILTMLSSGEARIMAISKMEACSSN